MVVERSRRMVSRGTSLEDFVDYFASNKRIRPFELQSQRSYSQIDGSSRYGGSSSTTNNMLYSVSWNCDGTQIATGSQDKIVSVGTFDISGKFRQTLCGTTHLESVNKIAWHPSNPSLLASASADRSVCIWDTRQKNAKPGRISTKAAATSVTWSPCGQYLVVGDKDERLSLIEGRTFSIGKTVDFNRLEVNEFVYDHTGNHLIVALGSGKMGIVDMPDFVCSRTIQAHSPQSSCISIAISASGDRLAVGASDALCSIWDTTDLICDRVISRLDYMIRAVSFSHDGLLLAVGSEDHTVDVAYVEDGSRPIQWVKAGENLQRDPLERLDYMIRAVSFSHDGLLLAVGSEDHTVDVAYVEDGSRVAGVATDSETYSIAWHPRAHLLALACGSSSDSRRDSRLKVYGFPST